MATPAISTISVTGKIVQKSDQRGLANATITAESESLNRQIRQVTQADGTYLLPLEPGRWKITLECAGFVRPVPREEVFNADTQLDFALEPGVTLEGTVLWYGTKEHVSQAAIQMSLVISQGEKIKKETVFTDKNGDFKTKYLEPGKWSFVVLHENGLPSEPFERTITENVNNLTLKIPRRQGTVDLTAGWIFMAALILLLAGLVTVYILAHNQNKQSARVDTTVFLSQVDQAILQLTNSQNPSTDTALGTSITAVSDTWSIISATTALPQTKTEIDRLVANIREAILADDKVKAGANLQSLRQMVVEETSRLYFWSQEPWRYLEVIFWGLAGILVYLITTTGHYLRWQQFYREGIPMHLSQAVSIPVLALVFVLLISQVTLGLTISGTQVALDLSDPRILAAFSFIIGSQPWDLIRFFRSSAAMVTGIEPKQQAKPKTEAG